MADASKAAPPSVVLALLVGIAVGFALVGAGTWLVLSRNSGRTLLGRVWSAVTQQVMTNSFAGSP
jgi:hypothetical protein